LNVLLKQNEAMFRKNELSIILFFALVISLLVIKIPEINFDLALLIMEFLGHTLFLFLVFSALYIMIQLLKIQARPKKKLKSNDLIN
jgi:hypothetical protein